MADHDFLPDQAPARAAKAPRHDHSEGAADAAALPSLVGNAAFTRIVRSGAAPAARAALRSQGAGPLDPGTAEAIDAQRGSGTPLPDAVRTDMEHHLGAGLDHVRVHTDAAADTLSRAVQAEAFTTGSDVFFAAGRYDPASGSGRGRLAHELTHTVQHATGQVAPESRVTHPSEPSEVEAAKVGDAVAASPVAALASGAPGQGAPVARQDVSGEEEEVQRQAAPGGDEEEEFGPLG